MHRAIALGILQTRQEKVHSNASRTSINRFTKVLVSPNTRAEKKSAAGPPNVPLERVSDRQTNRVERSTTDLFLTLKPQGKLNPNPCRVQHLGECAGIIYFKAARLSARLMAWIKPATFREAQVEREHDQKRAARLRDNRVLALRKGRPPVLTQLPHIDGLGIGWAVAR